MAFCPQPVWQAFEGKGEGGEFWRARTGLGLECALCVLVLVRQNSPPSPFSLNTCHASYLVHCIQIKLDLELILMFDMASSVMLQILFLPLTFILLSS